MIPFFLSIFVIYMAYGEEKSEAFPENLRKKLLENAEVKEAFDLCKSENICPNYDCSSNSKYDNFDDCIWKNISTSTQKNLSEVFAKQNLGPVQAPASIKKQTDPAMEKLRKYLRKRLQEALYGEAQEEGRKRKRVVNHVAFIHLYESQVGKNVILVVSSYCFDAYSDNSSSDGKFKYLIPTDKQQIKVNRETNSRKLSELDPYGTNDKTSSSASVHWNRCIQVVQHICHKNTEKYNDLSGNSISLTSNSQHAKMIENSSKRPVRLMTISKKQGAN